MAYNFTAASVHEGLAEFDTILQQLDKQGSIEENMMVLDRAPALSIDNMLAQQNSHGAGGIGRVPRRRGRPRKDEK